MKTSQGHGQNQLFPIGAVVIRTRHKRGKEQRAWVKIGEPSRWKLRAQVVWEQHHGPILRGMLVHHKDRNKLNDDISNLELTSRGAHVNEHRPEFEAKRIQSVRKAATGRTWSTKSSTKQTGRPPTWNREDMVRAVEEARLGLLSVSAVARKHNVGRDALRLWLKQQ